MRHYWLNCVGLAFISALCATPATSWSMTADELIKQTGIAGGLCSFPCAISSDEPLAFDLAKRPSFVVHLLSKDVALVAHMRAKAEAEGILGRSFYVETGGAMPLPFADRLVDVLVASGLCAADLTLELRNEWLRVLGPRRGVAFVGRAKTVGDGLALDALKTWTKDLPLTQTITNDAGVWALLKTDLPAGSDPWSHRCHGPDNVQVSSDTTFKWPFLTQWWGMPRLEGFWGMTMVSGNGRLFSIRATRYICEQVFLTARSLNNGVVLWQKILRQTPEKEKVQNGGFISGRSCVVVIGDTLYLAEKDGVLLLNAETGEIRDRIAGPKPGGQIKWLASVEGLLAVLAGEVDIIQTADYQTFAANPVGRELAVYDLASKRELWRDTTTDDVNERIIALRGKYLYYMIKDVGVVCRELNTGKTVWTMADPNVKTEFKSPVKGPQPNLLALEDVLLLRARWAENLVSLSREDGHVLWKKPALRWGGRGPSSAQMYLTGVPLDKLWLFGREAPIDLKTGEPVTVKDLRFTASGCGPTMATPNYLITCAGQVMAIKGKLLRCDDLRVPCDIGSIVSEGMLISAPAECICTWSEVKGYRVVASSGSIQPHTAPPWKDRLTVLDTVEPAALAVTDADWPTYRHDSQRSGATGASVGTRPKVLWQWKPANTVPYSSYSKEWASTLGKG